MMGSRLASVGTAAILMACAGAALAQSASRPCVEPARVPSDPAQFSPAQIEVRRRDGLQLQRAVEAERARVWGLMLDARRVRDLPRYQCLFNRLTQLDWLVTASGEGANALTDAIFVGDHGRREHSFRLLQIYRQRAGVLGVESARCGQRNAPPTPDRTEVSVRVPVAVSDADE